METSEEQPQKKLLKKKKKEASRSRCAFATQRHTLELNRIGTLWASMWEKQNISLLVPL